jgi:shikimate dehydrogenase
MILTGAARVAGIIGWPVAHSRSPRLHGFWLNHYGIDGAYVPLAVPPERAMEAIRALPALGFCGANVTVPHKQAALAAADESDEIARRIGAVNTLVVAPDGRLLGRNSDGAGFLENLRAGAPDWRAAAGPAVVLGAGGAARAVVVALLDAGAPEIRLVNRTAARAKALAEALGEPRVTIVDWSARAGALEDAALLVNTTVLGMAGQPALKLDLSALPATALVNDIVYTPLKTGLLAAAQARGNRVVDGLGMLLYQARPGFAAWFGIEPEITGALREFMLDGIAAR